MLRISEEVLQPKKWQNFIVPFCIFRHYPSRTPIHFLQESVRFHFQDLGRQCIILAGILEDLGR